MMKPLIVASKNYIGFLKKKQIIAIQLINYIDLNNSLHHVNNLKIKIQLQYI